MQKLQNLEKCSTREKTVKAFANTMVWNFLCTVFEVEKCAKAFETAFSIYQILYLTMTNNHSTVTLFK